MKFVYSLTFGNLQSKNYVIANKLNHTWSVQIYGIEELKNCFINSGVWIAKSIQIDESFLNSFDALILVPSTSTSSLHHLAKKFEWNSYQSLKWFGINSFWCSIWSVSLFTILFYFFLVLKYIIIIFIFLSKFWQICYSIWTLNEKLFCFFNVRDYFNISLFSFYILVVHFICLSRA